MIRLFIDLLLKRMFEDRFDVIHQLQLEMSIVPFASNVPFVLSGYLPAQRASKMMSKWMANVLLSRLSSSSRRLASTEEGKKVDAIISDLFNRVWWHYKNRFIGEERFLKKAKIIIARHTLLRDWLIRAIGLNAKVVKVIPGCVNTEVFKPLPDRKRKETLTILYVGGLRKIKGIDVLVRAMVRVVNEIKNVELIVVGEGSMKPSLLKLVKRLELQDHVKFLGHVPRYALPELYNESDVFCLPSFYESFGFVTLEAMSCGRPIVASNIGGIRDIVRDGVDGLLVTPGDVDELGEALVKLLSDEEMREKNGVSG